MQIFGDVRSGADYVLTAKPENLSNSTFCALTKQGLHVTRRLVDLFQYDDDTPVLAHWHGQFKTDGFATTVGELKRQAGI